MATITVKSIGSGGGRDYSTLQAWEDACPANLVTSDEVWKGECYNDSEFLSTSGALLTISGSTTDATRYLWLTTASGQSFADHASKLTNALKYNQSNGVGLRSTAHIGHLIDSGSANVVVEKLQLSKVAGSTSYRISNTSAADKTIFKDCIIETDRSLMYTSGPPKFHQCVIWFRGSPAAVNGLLGAVEVRNCSIFRPTDLSAIAQAVGNVYSGYPNLKNTVVAGAWTAPVFGGTLGSYTASYNASDVTSANMPGTNKVGSITLADAIVATTDTARDARVTSASSPLVGVGTRDATITNDLDILGQARSTTTPTIGAMEYVAAATSSIVNFAKARRGLNRGLTRGL